MGSILTRALEAATKILNDGHSASARKPERPDPFVATHWMYAEIDEALEKLRALAVDIKEARLRQDLIRMRQLTAEMRRTAFQLHQMCLTAAGVFGPATEPM